MAVYRNDQLALENPKALVFGMAMGGVADPWDVVPFVGFIAFLMKLGFDFFL